MATRAVALAFHLSCFYFSAVSVVCVPFPFGVSDHCLFIYLRGFGGHAITVKVKDGCRRPYLSRTGTNLGRTELE